MIVVATKLITKYPITCYLDVPKITKVQSPGCNSALTREYLPSNHSMCKHIIKFMKASYLWAADEQKHFELSLKCSIRKRP